MRLLIAFAHTWYDHRLSPASPNVGASPLDLRSNVPFLLELRNHSLRSRRLHLRDRLIHEVRLLVLGSIPFGYINGSFLCCVTSEITGRCNDELLFHVVISFFLGHYIIVNVQIINILIVKTFVQIVFRIVGTYPTFRIIEGVVVHLIPSLPYLVQGLSSLVSKVLSDQS